MGRCNDEAILGALLSSPTVRSAAEKCGVSERTIYKRLENESFKQRYDDERKATFKRCSEALQARLAGAVEAITEVMDGESSSPQTRLNAAEAVLRHSLKFKETLELADKVEELERKFQALEERGEEL